MPTITITISGGGQTLGRTKTISAADLTNRFLPAHRAFYQIGRMPSDPPLTDDDVAKMWADDVLNRMKQRVQDYDRQQANIPPLDLT